MAGSIAAKRQYLTLDGLRGVAALLVVGVHSEQFFAPIAFPSAYLAVDLFFVLSGFVLEHAYATRFEQGLKATEFIKARIIRLYPLYLVGALIGTASGIVTWRLGAGELDGAGVFIASLTALLMLPSPTFAQSAMIYVFNLPAWSLFLELIANTLYGWIWPRLTSAKLLAIIAVAAVAVTGSAMSEGSLNSGATWPTLSGGLARVCFSFFVGVLIRRHVPARCKISGEGWLILVVATFLLVASPLPHQRATYDLLLVLLISPALIIAGSMVEPGPRSAQVFAFLGAISFPIYVVHYPIVQLANRAMRLLGIDPASTAPWSGILLLALVTVIARLLVTIDPHARRMLARAVNAVATKSSA